MPKYYLIMYKPYLIALPYSGWDACLKFWNSVQDNFIGGSLQPRNEIKIVNETQSLRVDNLLLRPYDLILTVKHNFFTFPNRYITHNLQMLVGRHPSQKKLHFKPGICNFHDRKQN